MRKPSPQTVSIAMTIPIPKKHQAAATQMTSRCAAHLPTLNCAQTLPGNLPPASHDQDIF